MSARAVSKLSKPLCALALALAPSWLLAGCEQEPEVRPQWLVHVGTDAALPGFGDRIRIDVLDGDGKACLTCSRVFDTQAGASLPLSFGVVEGDGARFVRARLYRAENTDAAGDPADPLIDIVGELPELAGQPLDVKVPLAMQCFGKKALPAELRSCDPATGKEVERLALQPGLPGELPQPGSWGGGDVPCAGETPAGMVCVKGGVLLLGSRSYAPFGADYDPVPEQLVRVSAFFLDTDELTVAALRPLIANGVAAPLPQSADAQYCAYTPAPGGNEAASVNCIDRPTASAACAALGKRLPSEAEWEYAAGNRSIESPFPWSLEASGATNEELCARAVLARGDLQDLTASRQCILIGDYVEGPQPGGSADDLTLLGVRNLGGNLSEWVSDDFTRYSDPLCWGPDVALRDDPRCVADDSLGVLRGGSWQGITYNSHVYFRRPAPTHLEPAFVGVRCAKDAH